jgi:hypothetical protein
VVHERCSGIRTMYIIFEVPICMSVVVRKDFVIAQNYRPGNQAAPLSPVHALLFWDGSLGRNNLDANVLADIKKRIRNGCAGEDSG